MSNKQNSVNWPIWLLVISMCLMLALIPREIAIRHGFDKTSSNVMMISTSGILIFIYAMIVDAIEPLFKRLFHKIGFQSNSKKDPTHVPNELSHDDSGLLIDYASERDRTLKKQEARRIAIEEKVIIYVAETMSPYVSKEGLSQLIENVISFIHFNTKPDFDPSCSVKVSDNITTTDLMHFGWNIAKPFSKPCAQTALFLKLVFADTFRNTEPETIEKKLRLNPLQGNIKINKDICGNCQSDVKSNTDECVKSSLIPNSKPSDAKNIALADMLQEDIPILVCGNENGLNNEVEVA